jgi:hypothetical protein
MPKFEDGQCRGVTSHGPCPCKNFVIGPKTVGHVTYVTCVNEVGGRACGHADATHRVKVIKGQVVPWETSESDVKPLKTAVRTVEWEIPASASKGSPEASGGMSPAEARAILRKYEVPGVGARGRLSPKQWKKARELKESEK